MKILLVNWNDRENPQAGGAEIHLHELFGRIAKWGGGHDVRLIASGWPDCASQVLVDGIQVTRIGGRHSFALRARGAVRRAWVGARAPTGDHRQQVINVDRAGMIDVGWTGIHARRGIA